MSCTRISDVYLWRQSILLVTFCVHSVGIGMMLSFPAVLNPAILSPNSTGIRATSDQASWIASSQGIAGVVGFCLVPQLMQILGRKSVHNGINFLVCVGFGIFALASNISMLFAARITQGFTLCGVYVTSIMVGEYSDSRRRGYFITLIKCSVALGSLLCHTLALLWSWKQIAMFAMSPPIIAIIMTFAWPESPAFLALNGRYEECDKSHTWLYGDSPKNKKDLEELIAAQMEVREKTKNKKKLKIIITNLFKKDFMKPFIIVSLLTVLVDACGRYYMVTYITQILIEITQDESIAAYCTVGADLLTITALFISCFLIRYCKRRSLLFTTGVASTILMFFTSLITVLRSRYYIRDSLYWLTPTVILLNVFTVNVGVIPVSFAIIGEIFPLEHKGSGSCATGIVFTILYALVMKFTPLMTERTGVEGTFGIYGFHVFLSLLILYFVLNETKDKTLQEIEIEIKGIKQFEMVTLLENR